jgi:hypothetical protein
VIDVRANGMAVPARVDQPLNRQVEAVRAIEREDKILGPLAMEKAIEPNPAFALGKLVAALSR